MSRFRLIRQKEQGRAGLVEAEDNALLYVEERGQGPALLLVHGWMMSGRYWRRQLEGLSQRFRVIAPDLRAHGNSAKALHGHTLVRYARDLRAVLEALGVARFALAGWSLGGPVCLEYIRQFGTGQLAALCLTETSPHAFGPPQWNTHHLAGWDFAGMNQGFAHLAADRKAATTAFINGMWHSGQAPAAEAAWMLTEAMAMPTPQAQAIYSDYLMRDYTGLLGQIDAPTLVVSGHGPHICFGPKTGGWLAGHIPGARLEVFDHSGHMPFYEEPDRYNDLLAGFIEPTS